MDDVTSSGKNFTGFTCEQISSTEVRVMFGRFGAHDAVRIACAEPLNVEVLDSRAVPTAGLPGKRTNLFDWGVALLALIILGVFVVRPIEDYLTVGGEAQPQDNINHALKDLIFYVTSGASLALIALLAEMLLVPVRRRQTMGTKTLRI